MGIGTGCLLEAQGNLMDRMNEWIGVQLVVGWVGWWLLEKEAFRRRGKGGWDEVGMGMGWMVDAWMA